MRKIKKRIVTPLRTNPYGYRKRIDYPNDMPFFEKFLTKHFPNINFELMNSGPNGNTYYFKVERSLNKLPTDDYLLKISLSIPTDKEIEIQIALSNNNLIPKIYLSEIFSSKEHMIKCYVTIQKFEEGIDLRKLYLKKQITPAFKKWIYNEVKKEYEKWKLLGAVSGDIKFSNILITTKGRVYLIDPMHGHRRSDQGNLDADQRFFENFYLWYMNEEVYDKNIFY